MNRVFILPESAMILTKCISFYKNSQGFYLKTFINIYYYLFTYYCKINTIKGTVSLILCDPPRNDCNARFTTVSIAALSNQV